MSTTEHLLADFLTQDEAAAELKIASGRLIAEGWAKGHR
jgi:hypothetical protein